MQRELGITFVHVTHTQLEAIALADLVVVMEKGKIRQAGAARDVYAQPQGPLRCGIPRRPECAVAARSSGQRPPAVVAARRRRPASPCRSTPGVHVDNGDAIAIAVRRDDIELRPPGSRGRPTATASVPSRVRAIEYQGYFVKVMLDAGSNAGFRRLRLRAEILR